MLQPHLIQGLSLRLTQEMGPMATLDSGLEGRSLLWSTCLACQMGLVRFQEAVRKGPNSKALALQVLWFLPLVHPNNMHAHVSRNGDISELKDFGLTSAVPDLIFHIGARARIQPSFDSCC